MRRRAACAGLLLFTTTIGIALMSCGGSSECVGAIPAPRLNSVQPTTIDSKASSTTLTLSGSGFISSSRVYLNSTLLASTVIDSHHITATVTPQVLLLISVSNGVEIVVTNPGQMFGGMLSCPNGGDSQSVSLTIT